MVAYPESIPKINFAFHFTLFSFAHGPAKGGFPRGERREGRPKNRNFAEPVLGSSDSS